jgi:Undecaprenyl-phosphate galactose phosphotransferase WbaP
MSGQSGTVSELRANPIVRTNLVSVRLRKWICLLSLVASDIAAFVFASAFFCAGRNVPQLLIYKGSLPGDGALDLFHILAAIFILARYIAGDYTRRQLFWDGARLSTIALMFTSLPNFLIVLFVPADYSLTAFFLSWTCVIIAVPLFRQFVRWLLYKARLWQVPTALIGKGDAVSEAFDAFQTSLSLGYDVRYIVRANCQDDHISQHDDSVCCLPLSDTGAIVRRLSDAGCQQAVVALEIAELAESDVLLQRLLAADIKVAVIPPLRGLPLLGLSMNYFFGRELLLLHVRNNLVRLPARILKRCADVVISALLLVALSPVLAVVAALVRREDGGKPFFVQARVGVNGDEFRCVKFRTMRQDAEAMLTRWRQENSPIYQEYVACNFKLKDDPRATKIGRWLRRTSLDELPQLFNVLIGEMSLVGPRPLIAREITAYGPSIELYKKIRPGITGLWQITGRSSTSFDHRVTSDEWYIKNWSFWYDLVIMLKTAAVLIRRDGAF